MRNSGDNKIPYRQTPESLHYQPQSDFIVVVLSVGDLIAYIAD